MITQAARQRLLQLARQAVTAQVTGGQPPRVPRDLEVAASGVFVTVYHRGELRGCLGTLDPRESVAAAVVRLAADVSHRDQRFAALRPEDLSEVRIDISVLTAPVPVTQPDEILIGRDGLIVEQGPRRGLLLPQVAPEHGFDRDTFLAHTCQKAGLPPDAWRHGATVWRFEAEVLEEGDPRR